MKTTKYADVSIERLHELFRLDPDTGRLYRRFKRGGYPAGSEAGDELLSGYRRVRADGHNFCSHRVVFAMTHGRWPDLQVDHINGDRSDNRPANLREATNGQNGWNARPRHDNKSGIKGVTWHTANESWQARIKVGKREIYLGSYNDIELAELVVAEARRKYHGEFSRFAPSAAADAAQGDGHG